jgi:hypothetical protein
LQINANKTGDKLMSTKFLIVGLVLSFSTIVTAQTARPDAAQFPPAVQSSDPVQNISIEISRISRSVEALNRNWKTFFDNFSTNQGLQLTERQQKLIMALEVLNRIETSLANMQRLKLDLIERQSKMRIQLASVNDDLLPQSIDRYIALRGTTDAEGLREIRRLALQKEYRELTLTLSQIQNELENTLREISRTELQVRTLRARIYW